jgi:integration host factor subunit beta
MGNEKKRIRTLTRRDIAEKIAESTGERPEDTIKYVESVFIAMRELLKTADPEIRIEIRTFGVFEVKLTKEKPQARNPKTGEIVKVPARRKTHFKPSKYLKEFLQIPQDQLKKVEEILARESGESPADSQ